LPTTIVYIILSIFSGCKIHSSWWYLESGTDFRYFTEILRHTDNMINICHSWYAIATAVTDNMINSLCSRYASQSCHSSSSEL